MNKKELIQYLNDNTTGKVAGRKIIKVNDIFISGTGNTSNYRLTAFGKDIIKKHFDAYTITLTSETKTETGNQILTLDRYLHSPYYIHKGKLILFETTVAAELSLLDGDFDLWVSNKKTWQSKRIIL